MKIFYKLKKIIEKPWWSFAGFAIACFALFGLTGKDIWGFLMNFEWVIDATKVSIIGGAIIFAVSAYYAAKEKADRQNNFEININTVIDVLKSDIEAFRSQLGESEEKTHTRTATIADNLRIVRNELKLQIGALKEKTERIEISKPPIPDWLTGRDTMRYYDLSHDLLMQYVRNGLSVYPSGTDVLIHGDEVPPLKEDELAFEVENEDYSNYRFKRADIEKFSRKPGHITTG